MKFFYSIEKYWFLVEEDKDESFEDEKRKNLNDIIAGDQGEQE